MGLYVFVVLHLVLHSILVAVDTLVAEGTLVVVHIPVEEEGNLVVVDIPVDTLVAADTLAEEHILVEEEGNLVVAHTPGVDILEVAFAAQPCRIVVAHVDQDLSHAFLLVAVRVVVLLLVVRMVAPGCSYGSPS